jgi:hypothetical protein
MVNPTRIYPHKIQKHGAISPIACRNSRQWICILHGGVMQRDKVYKNIRRNIVFVLDNGEIFVLGQNKDVEVSNGYCCVSKNKERKCARS